MVSVTMAMAVPMITDHIHLAFLLCATHAHARPDLTQLSPWSWTLTGVGARLIPQRRPTSTAHVAVPTQIGHFERRHLLGHLPEVRYAE